jgi:glycine/D-amino acid oxidase-like deaminating enzyme
LSVSFGKPFIDSLGSTFTDFQKTRVLNPKPNQKGLAKAASLFLQEFPDAGPIEIESSWAGYIDYMPDALPVISASEMIEGLIVAAGFSGNGFAIGPGAGQAIANLITTGDSGLNLSPFSTQRYQ